jgi:predicted secreted protein
MIVGGMVLLSALNGVDAETGHEVSVVIDKENQKTAHVAVSQPFLVKLPVRLGTGFSWSVTRLPKSVVILNRSVETPSDLRPGGSEYQVFRMQLNDPNKDQIVFSLTQSFDSDQRPSRTVKLDLLPSQS